MNPTPSSSPESTPAERTTIILAEDDQLLIGLVRLFLQRGGYDVLTATDGQQAVDLLQANLDRVKLAILDMTMPVMDGRQCLKVMKQMKPSLKTLFLTGGILDAADEQAAAREVNGYLIKPVQREQLLAEVRKVLES